MTKEMTIEDLAQLIQNTMASKEDLQQFATKEDLKLLATKEDLHRLEQGINERFDHVDARLDTIEHDISDLPQIRQDRIDIDERLTKVELRVAHA